jgi:hypothetical protein
MQTQTQTTPATGRRILIRTPKREKNEGLLLAYGFGTTQKVDPLSIPCVRTAVKTWRPSQADLCSTDINCVELPDGELLMQHDNESFAQFKSRIDQVIGEMYFKHLTRIGREMQPVRCIGHDMAIIGDVSLTRHKDESHKEFLGRIVETHEMMHKQVLPFTPRVCITQPQFPERN